MRHSLDTEVKVSDSGSKNPKRAAYLDNRQLALRIHGEGFDVVAMEVGDRMDPIRASKIVDILLTSGHAQKDIDRNLLAVAARKRPGHVGGPVKPPLDGEVREYTVGANGRIGLSLSILGKSQGDKAKVRFAKNGIRISP